LGLGISMPAGAFRDEVDAFGSELCGVGGECMGE
jgi:hypothetical protein